MKQLQAMLPNGKTIAINMSDSLHTKFTTKRWSWPHLDWSSNVPMYGYDPIDWVLRDKVTRKFYRISEQTARDKRNFLARPFTKSIGQELRDELNDPSWTLGLLAQMFEMTSQEVNDALKTTLSEVERTAFNQVKRTPFYFLVHQDCFDLIVVSEANATAGANVYEHIHSLRVSRMCDEGKWFKGSETLPDGRVRHTFGPFGRKEAEDEMLELKGQHPDCQFSIKPSMMRQVRAGRKAA
jgi:hypothetical protein